MLASQTDSNCVLVAASLQSVKPKPLTTGGRDSGALKGYLAVVGVIIYFLSGLLGVGLAINFVLSLRKGDLSPWWFWPMGIASICVLVMMAGKLMQLVETQSQD